MTYEILWGDDEPHVTRLYQKALRDHPFTFKPVQSVPEALKAIRASTPDGIITDFDYMDARGGNGVDLVRKARSELSYKGPIILLSSNTLEEIKSTSKTETIDAHYMFKDAGEFRKFADSIGNKMLELILESHL